MTRKGRGHTVTRWFFVVVLQLPAILLLQSCKNDRAAPPVSAEAETQDRRQERAVFGSEPERIRPRAAAPDRSKTQERARQAESATERNSEHKEDVPPEPLAIVEPQRTPVKDPGEHGVPAPAGRTASNRSSRAPAAERFLHYQPPGSVVGDAGELAQSSPQQQVSASMKHIQDLIRQWADTLLAGDLDAHLSLYAPTLSRFNGSSNVARGSVRASKQRLLSGAASVRRFEIYDVQLRELGNGSMHAEFRIESSAGNGGIGGWYRLELRQSEGQWKIYGEEKMQPVSRRSRP